MVRMKSVDLGLGFLQCHISPGASCLVLHFLSSVLRRILKNPNIPTHIQHLAQCLAYSKYSISISCPYYRFDPSCRGEVSKVSINPQERGPEEAEDVLA